MPEPRDRAGEGREGKLWIEIEIDSEILLFSSIATILTPHWKNIFAHTHTHTPLMLRDHSRKGGRKNLRLEKTREKIMSSGCGRTTAFMNSQQLCLPTQDLHKTKPVNILALSGKVILRSYPKSNGQWEPFSGRESQFS